MAPQSERSNGVLDADNYDAWVALLGDPVRNRAAYWHLVRSGPPALPAVREGLTSPIARVRELCTQALDHLVDEESFPQLISMLDDKDAAVRVHALHALACDRCKDTSCRPDKEDVLMPSVRLLASDPNAHARAMAIEVLGRWVHTDERAVEAIQQARVSDADPAVRKKAGWYAPGGTIYQKTAPKESRS